MVTRLQLQQVTLTTRLFSENLVMIGRRLEKL